MKVQKIIATAITVILASQSFGATYATLFGVGDYPQTRAANGTPIDNRLFGPQNDVPDLARVLHKSFSIPKENISEQLNAGSSSQNFVETLSKTMQKLEPGDSFVFYFSGHGLQLHSDVESDEIDEGIFLHDNTYIIDDEVRELQKMLNSFGVNTVFIFDSCFSGGMSRGPVEGTFRDKPVTFYNRMLTEKNFPSARPKKYSIKGKLKLGSGQISRGNQPKRGENIYLFASRENQLAREYKAFQGLPARGIFTLFLCELLEKSPTRSLNAIMNAIVAEFQNEGLADEQEPLAEYTLESFFKKPFLGK